MVVTQDLVRSRAELEMELAVTLLRMEVFGALVPARWMWRSGISFVFRLRFVIGYALLRGMEWRSLVMG